MFLSELEPREKKSFIVLAERFMSQDGAKVDEESEFFTQMKTEMSRGFGLQFSGILGDPSGYIYGDLGSSTTDADLFAAFKGRKAKTIAMLELIGLGHADSSYCALEEEFINRMADAFGFSVEEVVEIENWVLRQLALVRDARTLMTEV